MSSSRLLLLWPAVCLCVVTAMPEPPGPPPTAEPGGPWRSWFPEGENTTGPGSGALEAYCQMLLQGPLPPDQLPWFCQCARCQTAPGPKGDLGDRGLPGSPGSPGVRGMTGFRGPPGFVGRPGVKGQKGDEGHKGCQGVQGFTGTKGARGLKGDKGDPGLEGHPGVRGPKGEDGLCPEACASGQGAKGAPGLPGPAGPRGLPGSLGPRGPEGLKGDPGDAGEPGSPGPTGAKGDPGPQGDCECSKGERGAPGPGGAAGQKGNLGPEGPTGAPGPLGAEGPPGLPGAPGPCMPAIQAAFSASLASSFPPPNTPVIFSRVLYNLQGSYDPTSGFFTAPVNGTYVFSYSLSVHDRVLKVGLFHDFTPVVKTTEAGELGTASHAVVLRLARGGRVWLQVKNEATNGMFGGSEASSTFSGFLLHPDACDPAMLRGPPTPPEIPRDGFGWGSLPGDPAP